MKTVHRKQACLAPCRGTCPAVLAPLLLLALPAHCTYLEEVLVRPGHVPGPVYACEAVQRVHLARVLRPKGHLVDDMAHVGQLGQHMARQHLQRCNENGWQAQQGHNSGPLMGAVQVCARFPVSQDTATVTLSVVVVGLSSFHSLAVSWPAIAASRWYVSAAVADRLLP